MGITGREREGCADRPAVDLALGRLGNHPGVLRDRLAVEGREEELALTHVALADRRERGVRPDDRPQR